MATNFHLMGVGGSGAKAVSAFIHCAAAGLTPRSVTVSLLDQDANNGNISETANLITSYRRLHRDLGKKLPPTAGQMGLFATDIANPPNGAAPETPRVWLPLGVNAKTMSDHFHYPRLRPELKHLMRGLLNQREEIELQLDRGFRGRPAVGAVVISSLTDDHPLHIYLTKLASEGQARQRIFLMGSVFGGMGAAGIPTVARTLRRLRHGEDGPATPKAGANTSFAVGAASLLPYFEFPDPPDGSAAAEEIAVRASEIPWSSRLALEYYHSQITGGGQSEIFDHLYLVGQQPLTPVGYFSTGSGEQRNPALLPELLTALAGCHFFASDVVSRGQILRASHREKHIGWEDLPRVWPSDGPHEVRCGLAQLLRFAFAYRYAYFPCLYGDDAHKYYSFDWVRNLIGRKGLAKDDHDTALELNRYCTLLLRWLADIHFAYQKISPSTDTTLDFCNVDGFAERINDRSSGERRSSDVNRVRLKGDDEFGDVKKGREAAKIEMSDMPGLKEAFDHLIGGDSDNRALDLHLIYDALERSKARTTPGLAAFVDALWLACSVLPNKQLPKPPRWWL
jgi:hypothetical protein